MRLSLRVWALSKFPATSSIEISVTDTGVGISNKDLFEATQKSSAGTGNEFGAGIGLTLCKDYVTRLQGKIYYRNNMEDGRGSIFSFLIPIGDSTVLETKQKEVSLVQAS